MHSQRLPDWKKRPELSGFFDLPHPPKDVYFCGTWDDALFSSCVAVVGSRRITEYGKQVIEKIVPQLVFEKKTIVSGFMYGVDQYAHDVCMKNGGKTIAVLGWGIEEPLEENDKELARRIVNSGGLLLSEWKAQKPTLWTFPIRNRIVVALSKEVIIVEAALKSGSLITARIARELKRELWAVPGPITSKTSFGTNKLIADDHAKMWLGETRQLEMAVSDDPVIALIQSEPLTANDIARTLHKSVADVGAQLSLLTLTGQLVERGGKYYVGKN